MKIESKNMKVGKLFTQSVYWIPDYQRSYTWEVSEEISIFWEDFLYYHENEARDFFIGPMVFKAEDIDSAEREVIDGQQRLITISVMLSTLISIFEELGETDSANGLRQSLIFKDKTYKEQLAINTEDPHPFYQSKIFHFDNTVRPVKESEKKIEKASQYFVEKMNNLMQDCDLDERVKRMEVLRDKILNIDAVIIVSDDETDAFTIFETINTRGKNLSSLDLLKNYIFKNYPRRAGIEDPKTTWKLIDQNISTVSRSKKDFFNRFWSSWVFKVTENKLYRRFSDHMRDNKHPFANSESLLAALKKTSETYRKISQPKLDDWSENKNLHIFYHIKNINGLFFLQVHYPFLMALIDLFEDKKIKIDILSEALLLLENFHFIFTHIMSSRPSGLDAKYSKFAIKLREEDDRKAVLSQLKDELNIKLPNLSEYKEKFSTLNYADNKETIKFVLMRLEKTENSSTLIDLEKTTLDHLIPKSSQEENVHNIGNIFLLEAEYNENKDDHGPFDEIDGEKVVKYLKDNTKYQFSRKEFESIYNSETWTADTIKKRSEELAEATYKLFAV
jgi:uncharacterized protein with ParB-like and HNH nuclease domain